MQSIYTLTAFFGLKWLVLTRYRPARETGRGDAVIEGRDNWSGVGGLDCGNRGDEIARGNPSPDYK